MRERTIRKSKRRKEKKNKETKKGRKETKAQERNCWLKEQQKGKCVRKRGTIRAHI